MINLYQTVAAISTPPGVGGISVIRISGDRAVYIADRIFKMPSGKKLADVKTHTVHHGQIISDGGGVLDDVLVTVMRAPHTYTGEDVVEISCHGGVFVTKSVLEQVYISGAAPAGRGEFTKRAFLNGKLDLCEAESVIDIINSKTALEQSVSVNNLSGKLSEKINRIRDRILSLTAHVQVLIDYPDEELEPLSEDEFYAELISVSEEIQKLIRTSNSGLILRNGIKTAIIGKPNVGKSSLLNMLSGEEKAIVTDVEGTTRDAIEQYVSIGNVALKLTDTAGIRSTDNKVEAIGVQKSLDIMEKSDLVIFMADALTGLCGNDYEIIQKTDRKKCICLINKTESARNTCRPELEKYFDRVIDFSVKDQIGADELEKNITEMFELGSISENNESVITSARQRDALVRADEAVRNAVAAIDSGIPCDTTFIDLESAASAMGEIVGLTVGEEIVDKIFHNFCIGK